MRSLTLALLILGSSGAMAAERPVVVELFTSQGCSACPPAEAVLRELAGSGDVLALGFHVDYWDRLGWKDPYSSAAATARQRAYESIVGSQGSYTPQIVVDGRTDVVGSDRAAVHAAIGRAAGSGSAVPVTQARSGESVTVTVGAGRGTAKVLLIGFDRAHDTAVPRGENAGRTIQQADIVRSLAVLGEWRGEPLSLSHATPAGERSAVIVQAADGHILGVAD